MAYNWIPNQYPQGPEYPPQDAPHYAPQGAAQYAPHGAAQIPPPGAAQYPYPQALSPFHSLAYPAPFVAAGFPPTQYDPFRHGDAFATPHAAFRGPINPRATPRHFGHPAYAAAHPYVPHAGPYQHHQHQPFRPPTPPRLRSVQDTASEAGSFVSVVSQQPAAAAEEQVEDQQQAPQDEEEDEQEAAPAAQPLPPQPQRHANGPAAPPQHQFGPPAPVFLNHNHANHGPHRPDLPGPYRPPIHPGPHHDYYAQPREPPVRWNVIADLLKVLPPLKPTSDGVATFIFALDRVTEYSALTWVELTFVLTNRAQLGAVSAALLAELTSLDDYAQARAWLLGLFGASQTADHLDLEMESIRQRQGESVLDFFSRFRDLVLRLQTALGGPGQLPNTQLVRRFRQGLLPHLHAVLLPFAYNDLAQIFHHATRVEATTPRTPLKSYKRDGPANDRSSVHADAAAQRTPLEDHCTLHPNGNHTNAQCRAQHAPPASAPSADPPRTPWHPRPPSSAAHAQAQIQAPRRPPAPATQHSAVTTDTRVSRLEDVPERAPKHHILQTQIVLGDVHDPVPCALDSCSSHSLIPAALAERLSATLVRLPGSHRIRGITACAAPEPHILLAQADVRFPNCPLLRLDVPLRVSSRIPQDCYLGHRRPLFP